MAVWANSLPQRADRQDLHRTGWKTPRRGESAVFCDGHFDTPRPGNSRVGLGLGKNSFLPRREGGFVGGKMQGIPSPSAKSGFLWDGTGLVS